MEQNTPHMANSGAYQLVMEVSRDTSIRSGRFRGARVPEGYYVYTGSAMRNLFQRVARHLEKRGKRLRWHIDHLLAARDVRIIDVVMHPAGENRECDLNRTVVSLPGAVVPFPRFGSSDCRNCPGHLVHLRHLPQALLDRLPKYHGEFL
jgi:Uri superfamily endonuclease